MNKEIPLSFIIKLRSKFALFERYSVRPKPIPKEHYGYYISASASNAVTDVYFSDCFVDSRTLSNILTHQLKFGRVLATCYNPPSYFKEEK